MERLSENIEDGKDFLKSLGYEIILKFNGTCFVYKIRKGDCFYIAKMPNFFCTSIEENSRNQVITEAKVLQELNGIEGIPLFIDFFKDPLILIKEYIPGIKKDLFSIEERKRLMKLKNELFERGFIVIDSYERNVIVSREIPYLIDLGEVIFVN
ncbi:MAG: hypothetical protein QW727_01985 [Candidatus Pacearchaeota archaeon]